MRRRSLVRVLLTKSTAPGPATTALPRWLTSKMPTASRTAVCSLTTPEEYSSGIDQPPKAENFAPSASCRSWRGERSRSDMDVSLARTRSGFADGGRASGATELAESRPACRDPGLSCAGDDLHPAQRQP